MLNPWKKSAPKPSPPETDATSSENNEAQATDQLGSSNPPEAESPAKEESKVGIGEKVRFWQEQDKINKALIPRLVKMNETISLLSGQMSGLTSSIAASEARVMSTFEAKLAEIVANLEAQAKELSLSVTELEPRLAAVQSEAEAMKNRTAKSSYGLSMVAMALSTSVFVLEAIKVFLHGSIL